MKKLIKALIVLFGIFPLIINAQSEDEMKWRWYTFKESNIHYESEVENICGYLENYDKNQFIYSNWYYDLKKPDEKEYREIKEIEESLILDRQIFNILDFTKIDTEKQSLEIYELEFLDDLNNIIPVNITSNYINTEDIEKLQDKDLTKSIKVSSYSTFKVEFSSAIDISKIFINITYDKDETFRGFEFTTLLNQDLESGYYKSYDTNIENNCKNEKCIMKIKVKESNINVEDIIVKTKLYKYRDKLYKCYTNEKVYVPGYYNELEGFIKDEENYEIIKTETILEEKQDDYIFKIPVNSKLENEETENKELEENNQLAVVSKEETEKSSDITLYIVLLILLISLTIIITIAKFVKKRRTN